MTAEELDAAVKDLETGLGGYLGGGGRLAVIKAPPGSGKTHVLISALLELIDQGLSVAVAAQTNSQADDICRRIAGRDPDARLVRFASSGAAAPDGFPPFALWTTDKSDLSTAPGVTVSTTAKWALTDVADPFDVFAVDEAWQMAWADLMQCAIVSERFLLIGDPGQIPPVVTIDVRRWETSPRSPSAPAPEVVLGDQSLIKDAYVGSLPACRRLPSEAVSFIKPFYDFDFAAYVQPGERGLDLGRRHRLRCLDDGQPLALTVPTPPGGPPLEVDSEVAEAVVSLACGLLQEGAMVRDGSNRRHRLKPKDIGLTSSHRVMNAAISRALPAELHAVRVDTPERWQGLERPVMIAVHPLSGVVDPSAFDLETGRLCVMASRHQVAHLIVTRDHVGQTLADLIPSAEQAPGKPDIVGRGHHAHVQYWDQLERAERVLALN